MSFGHEGHITGEDMASAPFLPGGVWFMLACYGAGTPESSAFYPWLAKLRDAGHFPARLDPILAGLPREGERPFVASLPRAVLANPEGPLAFMGHIDLAWSYAFQELGSGATNRPARFMAILRSALKRDRLGISFRELYRFLEHTNYELTARFDQDARGEGPASAAERAARAHLWMLRQDLAAYILLGDPAVRLPVAGPSVQPSAGSDRTALLGFAPTPAAPAPSGSAITLAVEDLEEAIGQVLVGERGLRAIAREFELEPAQLRQVVDAYRAGGRAALAQRKLL